MTFQTEIGGRRYGMLTAANFVTRLSGNLANPRLLWLFDCDCGRRVVLFKDDVTKQRVISCGCARKRSQPGANDKAWLLSRQQALPLPGCERLADRFVVLRHGGSAPPIPSLLWLLQNAQQQAG